MKKISNKINMALIGMMLSFPAFAEGVVKEDAICGLVREMDKVFKMLRVFCFVGAAFMIAGWAWGYISSGKLGDKDKGLDELKGKGMALIVGFVLLFAVGLIFQFLTEIANGRFGLCANDLMNFGK